MMKKIFYFLPIYLVIQFVSCEDYYKTTNDPVVYGGTYFNASLNTDKARYKPDETVIFELSAIMPENSKVRYTHLGHVIKEENLSAKSWSWNPPSDDFKGYLIEIYSDENGEDIVYETIAVDVSSDWKKFPRYGFLSSFGKLSEHVINNNINILNRFHLNGVQFYDWMYEHHRPLAGTVESPAETWPDLIGRTNYGSTVREYIDALHSKGMKAMFYNLMYGALQNASSDGVKEDWYLFNDEKHSDKNNHHLDPPFRSSIYVTNPANKEWQDYIIGRHRDVYQVYDFDGYHIDQLGYRGNVYDYDGNSINLEDTFQSFVEAMKGANPEKSLIMNAVSQYGQENGISKSPVDFLYTEVWNETKTYEDLAKVITDNYVFSNYEKRIVLAAYMHYDQSKLNGFVNMPGILLANSVIFSFGGSHLELGEHYLINEYFPNSNLQMSASMKEYLMHYYDFLVAYQNLLRDGGEFANLKVEALNRELSFENWPASQGSIAVVNKSFDNKDVVHLINFSDVISMEWRDTKANQPEPRLINDTEVEITIDKDIENVWMASPDIKKGAPMALDFTQVGSRVKVTIPSLKFWDMLVLEYK